MAALTIEKIENAFLPAREIREPSRFAGRAAQIEQCYLALISEGANIAIVGNRGIGKSSLARQVVSIATGNTGLLDRHQIKHSGKLNFSAVYLACGSEIGTTDQLLDRLITSQDCLAPWIYTVPAAQKVVAAFNPGFSAKVMGFGVELRGANSTEVLAKTAGPAADTQAVFSNVLSIMAKEKVAKDGLLFVIDEFDQIRDPSGFASLLKSLATNAPSVKFCIVGVAHDLHNLIKEHESADRLFAGGVVNLPSMTDFELEEIVQIAEDHIDGAIRFEPSGRKRLIALAQGHPYMVHLVGKHSLRSAYKQKRFFIRETEIDETLRLIAASGADPVLEARYKKAIASSAHREAVLRALAESEKGGEVWTTDAYPIAIKAGVDNPSQYVGNLVTDDYGAEIVKVRERYYRFRDSLFRAYVIARPPDLLHRLAEETPLVKG